MPHPRSDCIKAVFADDDLLVDVIWAVIDAHGDRSKEAFSPDRPRFWDLYNDVEVLYEALVKRAATYQPPALVASDEAEAVPSNRVQRNMWRFTRSDPQPHNGER